MRQHPDYQTFRNELLAGKVTCTQQVNRYLDSIRSGTHLNAFLSVYEQEALERAAQIDATISSGNPGKLAGMVIGLKDVLSHEGHPLTAGSRILERFTAQYSATAVKRLVEAGAIIIGRQNCDEFAMGSSNENSAYGPVKNPVNPERVPGGSSGGSAAAVAAGMCHVSIGSDTGGSVRQPAAFCGVVGLKPTYSRVSRYGLVAYGSSFDCIGVFASSVRDCALVLEVMAGADGLDSTASEQPVPEYSKALEQDFGDSSATARKFRFAVLGGIPDDALAPDIRKAMEESVKKLKEAGHTVTEVSLPLNEYVLPTYYILTTAEASSNLSRYDGVRYGHRTIRTGSLEEMYKRTRTEGFGSEVRRRILLGNFVLTSDYYDAYYAKAQRVRRMIRDEIRKVLTENDFLLMPATPTTAFRLGEHSSDPVSMYYADLFSVQANVAGVPGISVPCGTDGEGLPVGLQLLADDFREGDLLTGAETLMRLQGVFA